jgi:DNA-binding MarR family transcriptional regulator
LGRLNEEGPVRLTALATAAGISQPSMTELVQRLERQGLAIRLIDPEDGRAALVDITNTGRALLDERRRDRRERLAELLTALSPDDEATLTLAVPARSVASASAASASAASASAAPAAVAASAAAASAAVAAAARPRPDAPPGPPRFTSTFEPLT